MKGWSIECCTGLMKYWGGGTVSGTAVKASECWSNGVLE